MQKTISGHVTGTIKCKIRDGGREEKKTFNCWHRRSWI